MENLENSSYALEMLKQINQTTLTLSQNQSMLFEQYKTLNEKFDQLEKKVDDNYAKLDKKIDDNYLKLDKKIDVNCSMLEKKIDQNYANIIILQNNVKDLRTDIDTVYILEKDSRNKIQQLF
ncbi:MAG: hypothetical protein J6A04_06685 [Clostridia bacterium]|nr:hypothetical protein [Clostridia bacterium]